MTEIPEHLLKRAQERRAALGGSADAAGGGGEGGGEGGGDAAPGADDPDKIPGRLLTGTTPAPGATAAAAAVATAPAPGITGPAGHTQRLLTVVKAGSIQDVRATPMDKVHTWPHLIVGEFVAALAMTAFLLVFSVFVNAPLLGMANFNQTP
ncbi:MAG: menaquinol-cytochrome c reductase cytochrome b/c subunit, partial [Actinomycetota bacterium]